MTDELDRLRALADDPPPPPDEWVRSTRAELLAMARDEQRSSAAGVAETRTLAARLAAWWHDRGRGPVLAGATAVLVLVVGTAVGLSGVLDGPGGTPAPTPSGHSPPAATDAPVLASSCTGGDGRYTVSYPRDWSTDLHPETVACQVFDDQPVDLETGVGGSPLGPVSVLLLDVPFDRASAPGPEQRERTREATTVAGRPAVVVDWVATGRGADPAGQASHRILVDLGDDTLMLRALGIDDHDLDRTGAIVDRMADTLRLHRSGS